MGYERALGRPPVSASAPVAVVTPIPVVTETVVEIHPRISIIAIMPVAIVRLLNRALFNGGDGAEAQRRRCAGSPNDPKVTTVGTGTIHLIVICVLFAEKA